MIDTVTARAAWSRAIYFAQTAVLLAVFLLVAAEIPAQAQSADNAGASSEAGAKVVRPKNDLLVDRGTQGLWVFKNNTTWQKLDAGNPTGIAVGDLNADGRDDIIFGLATPASRKGTWTRIGSTLKKIDPRAGVRIAAGDFDGDGRADLITTFQGVSGTHLGQNNTPSSPAFSFFNVHSSTAVRVATGDLTGDNIADVIIALPNGLWVCYNAQDPWTPIGPPSPPFGVSNVAVGDINGDGQDDLFIDREAQGVWRSMDNGATWTQINTRNPSVLAPGDADGNGRDGAFATFPNPNGGLFTSPTATPSPPWIDVSPMQPTSIAVGRLDNNTKEDIVVIVPNQTNLQVRMNNTGAFKPLKAPPGPAVVPQGVLFFAFD